MKKLNIPKKGAAKKWSQRLGKIGRRKPPESLVENINQSKLSEEQRFLTILIECTEKEIKGDGKGLDQFFIEQRDRLKRQLSETK